MDPRYPLKAYLPIENASIKSIDAILRRAAKDLERDIKNSAGAAGVSAVVSKNQMTAQLAAIRKHLEQDWSKIATAVSRGQAAAYAESVRVVSALEWPVFKGLVDKSAFDYVVDMEAARAARSVRTVMDRLTGSYLPLSEQVYKTSMIADGWVDNAVNSALARGLTTDQFAKEVRRFIDPDTPGGVSYAARRLARTEINNAYHIGTQRRYAEHGIVQLVNWNLSSSHPEGDECDDYKAESPYRLEDTPDKPHPQCLCFITPALPSPEEFIAALMRAPVPQAVEDIHYAGARASVLQRAAQKLKMSYLEYQDYVLSGKAYRLSAGPVMPGLLNTDFSRNVFLINAQRAARTRAITAPAPALSYTSRHWWRRDNGGTTLVAWRKPTRTTGAPRTMPPSQSSLVALRKPALEELSAARLAVEPVRNQPSYVAATTSLQRQNQLKGLKYISFEELPQTFKQDLMKLPVWDYMQRNAALATVTGGEFHDSLTKQMRQALSDLFGNTGWKVDAIATRLDDAAAGTKFVTSIRAYNSGKSVNATLSFGADKAGLLVGSGAASLEVADLLSPILATFPKNGSVDIDRASGLNLKNSIKAGWYPEDEMNVADAVSDAISEMLESPAAFNLKDADIDFLRGAASEGPYMSLRDVASYAGLTERAELWIWKDASSSISKSIAPAPGAVSRVIPKPDSSSTKIPGVPNPVDGQRELIMVKGSNKHIDSTLPDPTENRLFNEAEFALDDYVGDGYMRMNEALRDYAETGSMGSYAGTETERNARKLTEFLYSSVTAYAGVVVREEVPGGIVKDYNEFREILNGKSIVGRSMKYDNFVSTSYFDEDNVAPIFNYNIKMEIFVPQGSFGSLAANDEEREFILAPGSTFRIVGQEIVDEANPSQPRSGIVKFFVVLDSQQSPF